MEDKPSSMVFLHYLTTVFDNIDEAIMLIGVEPDGEYRLLLANNAYSRITGRTEAPIGKLLSKSVSPQAYRLLKKQYGQVVATKKPAEFTEWYDVPLGKQAFRIRLIPILNAIGQTVQIAAITKNITELVNLREEVVKLRAEASKQ